MTDRPKAGSAHAWEPLGQPGDRTGPPEPGDLVQALQEIARNQRPLEGRHVVVAVATQTAQLSSVTADGVLEQLRGGRAVLYAATIAGSETTSIPVGAASGGRRLDLEGQVTGLERDKVFGQGTRQTSGLGPAKRETSKRARV